MCLTFAASGQTEGEEGARNRYAMILQDVGPGLASNLRNLLIESGYDEEEILCYGRDAPFAQYCAGEPTSAAFLSGFDSIAGGITDRDTLILAFICHMKPGCVIDGSLSSGDLNAKLGGIPDGATIVVILEGCYAAAAIPALSIPDVVYASAGADEACYGGWMLFFLNALGLDENARVEADVDLDGFVSLGEAYDYAADRQRLEDWYATLSPDVWPDWMPTPVACRTDGELQYYLFLDPSALAPF